MHETIPSQDKSTILLNTVIGNKRFVRELNTTDNNQAVNIVAQALETFSPEETGNLVQALIRRGFVWNDVQKSAALKVLGVIDPAKIPYVDEIMEDYIDSVSELGSLRKLREDKNVHFYLEVGKAIAPFLNTDPELYDLRADELISAWESVTGDKENREPADIDFINNSFNGIMNLIEIPEPEQLGTREEPKFELTEKELHDEYLKVTNEHNSFKLTLWENTPDFRKRAKSAGIELENFWNLHDPSQVAHALTILKESGTPEMLNLLSENLKKLIDIDLFNLAGEQSRVVADEVIMAVDNTRKDLARPGEGFPKIVESLKGRLQALRNQPVRNLRAALGPIANFFSENAGQSIPLTLAEVEEAFRNEELMAKAESGFNTKAKSRQDMVTFIDQVFDGQGVDSRFQLISRTKDDLYLGDTTGDCTAYHLNIGFNAWTVPVWLTNPGFTMFKIVNGQTLIAKVGLTLGTESGKPVLVIDSIETGKKIEDEEKAKKDISDGLQFLSAWSRRIGFQSTLLATFTNSTEAIPLLDEATGQHESASTFVLGGTSGVAELRRNLLGKTEEEKIYLQSTMYESWEQEEDISEDNTRNESLRYFEHVITKALQNASQDKAELIQQLIREGNWNRLFSQIVIVNSPFFADQYGTSIHNYADFLSSVAEYDIYSSYRPMTDIIDIMKDEGNSDKDLDKLSKEASNLDDLLISMQHLYSIGISPEMALNALYRGTYGEGKGETISLNPKLRILK